jgi:PAS domain S-box-containing protein/putative nucleotidyltransferase with HDIG domain
MECSSVTAGGRSLRVLCLEDSPADAELVSATLTRARYVLELSLAGDRAAFEGLLASGPYDVILADFALPAFDAHGALELAKAACPDTPFICVSGTIGEEATVELLKQGADDCVLKDKMARLPFAVQRAIDERARRHTLADSEARVRMLLAHAPVMLFAVDHDGVVTFADGAALRALGITPAEAVGSSAYDFFPERLAIRKGIEHALAGEPFETVTDIAGLSLEVRVSPLPRHNGANPGVIGVAMDVTERRKAQEALELSAARLRRTVEGAVEAMGAMIAARDPYTAGHEKRVTQLAVAIAVELGLDEATIEGLRLAGLVHDIGKLTVPAEILNKPSRLTPIEFELIKGHAAAAQAILKPIDFEYPVADIVAQHHERLDGSGYPAGLEAGAILPQARILAVADVVEAMASHRPYRAALGVEAALAEVHGGAGTRYEAAAVAACERVFARGFVFSEA